MQNYFELLRIVGGSMLLVAAGIWLLGALFLKLNITSLGKIWGHSPLINLLRGLGALLFGLASIRIFDSNTDSAPSMITIGFTFASIIPMFVALYLDRKELRARRYENSEQK